MPGLVPGIHALATKEDVDGRDKPGHDGGCFSASEKRQAWVPKRNRRHKAGDHDIP
jgi:hypothetical protein